MSIFIPLSLIYSAPLFPKRQCDRRTPLAGVKARANADFRAHRYALAIEGYSAVLAALDDACDDDDASPLPALEALRVTSLANRAQARGRGRWGRLCSARTSLQNSLAVGQRRHSHVPAPAAQHASIAHDSSRAFFMHNRQAWVKADGAALACLGAAQHRAAPGRRPGCAGGASHGP